jgi:hypothetical protein
MEVSETGLDQGTLILADAHVHVHDHRRLENLLGAAYRNFANAAEKFGGGDRFLGLLFLAELGGTDCFRELHGRARGGPNHARQSAIGTWAFQRTAEPCSLLATSDARKLFLIGGRQLVTAEGLEVLALAVTTPLSDGASLRQTLQCIATADGVPVIPWGVGKWFGARGAVVKRYLLHQSGLGVFLGDNGNRPTFWPVPTNFKRAQRRRVRVLPGTDPLPFGSDFERVGTFGFAVRGSLDPAYPARDMKALLRDPDQELLRYGSLENPWRFFKNQLRMQLRKRRKGT